MLLMVQEFFKSCLIQISKEIVTFDCNFDEESECFGWSKNSSKLYRSRFERKLLHVMITLVRTLHALDCQRILQKLLDPDFEENCYIWWWHWWGISMLLMVQEFFKMVQLQIWKKIVKCHDNIDEESECFGW